MKTFKQLREEVWDQPNPKKTKGKMTPQQKAEAKRRAKAAGRPYPNLIDNMAAMKEGNEGKTLNKPFLTPGGPKKRAVYVKNEKGNIIKVNFGDPNLEIKRDNPERRKSFRARHNCDNPGPKTKARYWSCKFWSTTPVSKL